MVTIVVWFDRRITVGGMAVAADTTGQKAEEGRRDRDQSYSQAPAGHQQTVQPCLVLCRVFQA